MTPPKDNTSGSEHALIVSVGCTQKPFSRTVCNVAAITSSSPREARPPDYFFVLGINTSAYAQFNRASRHKKKYRCGRAEGLQQR